MSDPNRAPAPASSRFDAIDLARGGALVAMAIFHGAWDLSNAGLAPPDVGTSPGWRWFAHLIAGSFLFLSGVSLVLAHRTGVNWPRFLVRLAMVAGAALLVTLSTWWMMGDAFVIFGILHHIALASVIALAFLPLPPLLTALAAALSLALPHLVTSTFFDPPWLIWTGLAVRTPVTVDWVPLFPWLGCVLAGVAAGPALSRFLHAHPWRAESPPLRLLALGGRHSLLVYLAHQPLLMGVITLLATVLASSPAPTNAMEAFENDCIGVCVAQKTPLPVCQASCGCAREGVSRDAELVAAIRANRLDPLLTLRLTEISRACVKQPLR